VLCVLALIASLIVFPLIFWEIQQIKSKGPDRNVTTTPQLNVTRPQANSESHNHSRIRRWMSIPEPTGKPRPPIEITCTENTPCVASFDLCEITSCPPDFMMVTRSDKSLCDNPCGGWSGIFANTAHDGLKTQNIAGLEKCSCPNNGLPKDNIWPKCNPIIVSIPDPIIDMTGNCIK